MDLSAASAISAKSDAKKTAGIFIETNLEANESRKF